MGLSAEDEEQSIQVADAARLRLVRLEQLPRHSQPTARVLAMRGRDGPTSHPLTKSPALA